MSFLSKLFGKKEKNEVEQYMEQRKKDCNTYEGASFKEQEYEIDTKGESSWRENKLLLGDVTQIPEQYYFRKDEDMLLFVDYFHEGIFYAGSYGVDEEEYAAIGFVYSLIRDPEKAVEQWRQKFLEQKKKAETDSFLKDSIIEAIDDVLYTITTFGLQDCERYILPVSKEREMFEKWDMPETEDEFTKQADAFSARWAV